MLNIDSFKEMRKIYQLIKDESCYKICKIIRDVFIKVIDRRLKKKLANLRILLDEVCQNDNADHVPDEWPYYLSNCALVDITDIGQQIVSKNERISFLQQFYNAFQKLSKNSVMGKKCDYIMVHLRKYYVENHVIFYTISNEKEIDVIRILHKRFDVN